MTGGRNSDRESEKRDTAQNRHIQGMRVPVCAHVSARVCVCVCVFRWVSCSQPGGSCSRGPVLRVQPEVSGQQLSPPPPPRHLPDWISCGQSPLNKCTSSLDLLEENRRGILFWEGIALGVRTAQTPSRSPSQARGPCCSGSQRQSLRADLTGAGSSRSPVRATEATRKHHPPGDEQRSRDPGVGAAPRPIPASDGASGAAPARIPPQAGAPGGASRARWRQQTWSASKQPELEEGGACTRHSVPQFTHP